MTTIACPAIPGLAPGLFGKMPAHGDFVRRGWPDETADAIDRWLSDAMLVARSRRDEEAFAGWLHAAPMWEGHVPAGLLGPHALWLAVAPSIDRAGRLFPLVAGMAGSDAGIRAFRGACSSFAAALDEAVYDAVAGRLDADALLARLADAGLDRGGQVADAGPPSAASLWWPSTSGTAPDAAPLSATSVDAALLERLMAASAA